MAKWYKIPLSFRITEREYRANINGINIVFGAVLGFVLAGAEGLPPQDFAGLLFISAFVVVMILYLGSTEYTLFYALATAASIVFLPFLLEVAGVTRTEVPQLQPTLGVWAIMIVLAELTREKTTDA
jgi:hypothetical protein